jgi:hypothetical protein
MVFGNDGTEATYVNKSPDIDPESKAVHVFMHDDCSWTKDNRGRKAKEQVEWTVQELSVLEKGYNIQRGKDGKILKALPWR